MARKGNPSHLKKRGVVVRTSMFCSDCSDWLGLRSWFERLRPFAVDSRGGGGRAAGDVGRGLRVVGSSPTVVVCVGALELGSPFPSRTPSSTSAGPVKLHEAGRYPARPWSPARLSLLS